MDKKHMLILQDFPGSSKHNILVSIPRTASNLITHLLALPDQASLLAHPRGGYFFLPALSHRFKNATFQRAYSAWNSSEKREMDAALQSSASEWENWVANADAQSLGTYVKEHVNWTIVPSVESSFLHRTASSPETPLSDSSKPTNPTAIPDAFWSRFNATLLIRHPALTFPSALRTAIDNEGLESVLSSESETVMRWECTFHWHVLLYKFLVAQQAQSSQHSSSQLHDVKSRERLIIDASQLEDPEFVRQYASKVGLDAGRTRTQWEATSADEQNRLGRMERRMKDTLLDSTGIVKGKLDSGNIDILEERKNWEEEFGDVLAERLERLVRAAMGEYEWLYERRWRG
ncbi:hypothetical protein SVAN01_03007 [Stagonosporopsis vannaccii]|nr:hypothetical protein SVAN01_03007 [Stagonosporopsis vannaccii]